MSERNGDRARFQKNGKLRYRERVRALAAPVPKRAKKDVSSRAASRAASLDMLDEGSPLRAGD